MRHVDAGQTQTPLNLFDLIAHAGAELCVEVGQRLIKEHDARLGDQRAGRRLTRCC